MELKRNREAYSYPPVGLTGTIGRHVHIEFNASSQLDEHHGQMLRSTQDEQVLLGYLSVLYWGHYSTSTGRTNSARALSKVQAAVNGSNYIRLGVACRRRGLIDFTPSEAVRLLREATRLVDLGRFGEAVRVLCALPQLQFAFASKVVAFLAPSTCGVIDSVVAQKQPAFGFKLQGRYVSAVNENFRHYEVYCDCLAETAATLNQLGKEARWVDRDGRSYPWRAVDVERAMYSQWDGHGGV